MDARPGYAETDAVGLGRAMLALLLSSLLTAVVQVGVVVLGAEPHSLGGTLVYFVAVVLVEASLLRLCLGWFGWTISLKAAVVARVLAGVASVIAVAMVFAAAPLRNIVVGFLVAFVVQYLVAGWIVVLTADPLEKSSRGDLRPTPAPRPVPAWQSAATVYSAEDFRADTERARVGKQSS